MQQLGVKEDEIGWVRSGSKSSLKKGSHVEIRDPTIVIKKNLI
jgi:hypothetical protein